jgi:hypothetical protein
MDFNPVTGNPPKAARLAGRHHAASDAGKFTDDQSTDRPNVGDCEARFPSAFSGHL